MALFVPPTTWPQLTNIICQNSKELAPSENLIAWRGIHVKRFCGVEDDKSLFLLRPHEDVSTVGQTKQSDTSISLF